MPTKQIKWNYKTFSDNTKEGRKGGKGGKRTEEKNRKQIVKK